MKTGIDVSHWQGEMDWSRANADFAFVRAGSISTAGVLYKDYRFDENADRAPSLGPVGFYWFFRPEHDPEGQARYFADLILTKEWKLPPVCDVETHGGLTPGNVQASLKKFLDELERFVYTKPMIYTSPNAWRSYAGAPSWGLHYPLWLAHYTSGQPIVPSPWPAYNFWQYSDKGDGAAHGASSRYIDLNTCSDEELAKYIQPPIPDDDGLAAYVAVLEDRIDRLEEWAGGFDG